MRQRLSTLATITALAAALLLTAALAAEEAVNRPPPRLAGWQFEGENDALAAFSGSDEYYTNGIRLSWIRNPNAVPNPDWTQRLVDRWCGFGVRHGLCLDMPADIGYGHAFGQNFYTPDDIKDPNPQLDDRPWAGYLYYSWLVQATHRTSPDWRKDRPIQNLFELQVGIVGPAAQGEFVQREFHRLIDSPKPQGWDHQIDNEPAVNLIYLWRKKLGTSTFDIVPHWGAGLGNVMTYANAGATVRLGHNISNFPQLQIAPTNADPQTATSAGLPPPLPLPKTEFFVFLGADGRAVARNIFLDGNTFRDGPEIEIDKKHFVYDLKAGFTARYKSWRFDYTFVRRSEEFEPPPGRQQGLHDFGSFSISHTMWR